MFLFIFPHRFFFHRKWGQKLFSYCFYDYHYPKQYFKNFLKIQKFHFPIFNNGLVFKLWQWHMYPETVNQMIEELKASNEKLTSISLIYASS